MSFDSGAGGSVLHANFAKMFPKTIDGVKRQDAYFQGVDGGTKAESATVPLVLLRVGGLDASFRRMAVYLKGHGAESYDGVFGNDLTRKTREFTIDFEAMRLTMR